MKFDVEDVWAGTGHVKVGLVADYGGPKRFYVVKVPLALLVSPGVLGAILRADERLNHTVEVEPADEPLF